MKQIIIGCIIGTRPEVIKMASLIKELKLCPEFKVDVIITAQHRELLDDMLKLFQLTPDVDLNIMENNQTLPHLTASLCEKLTEVITNKKYDLWLVQGDTTTTFVASLIAFYHHIPCGHVEAGLRSFNLLQPFPEEMNRALTSRLVRWNFVPTFDEENNLLHEGIASDTIYITGNTVIDALKWVLKTYASKTQIKFPNQRLLLVTAHRRENFGEPLKNICMALKQLIEKFSDITIVYPVHPNPNVQKVVYELLQNQPRIHLIEPLSYEEFSFYLQEAYLVLTDSGGIQEEAPALKKPVLILRNTTERPALLTTGTGKLVGTDINTIVDETSRLLNDPISYQAMASGISPYGDGHASERIVAILKQTLLDY